MSKSNVLIHVEDVSKFFVDADKKVNVLQDVNFQLTAGEKIAIVGPSGSGKSTFLHLLGGLDVPNVGNISVAGQHWSSMSEEQCCLWRNQTLGFVYQFHHLLPELSAQENVMLPLLMQAHDYSEVLEKSKLLLDHMGLAERLSHRPHQLSGGERQRVAIARAMVTHPQCILADEPTGNLDKNTAQLILKLWSGLNTHYQTSMVIVTHDMELAKQMDKIYQLDKGTLSLLSQ